MVLSGKYKTGEQILRLTNERFAVPEILFHPSDIGIQEMGIPEAIVYSIQNLPEGITYKYFEKCVCGGCVVLFWFALGFCLFVLSIQSVVRSWYLQYASY